MQIYKKESNNRLAWIDSDLLSELLQDGIIQNIQILPKLFLAVCDYAEILMKKSIIDCSITIILSPSNNNKIRIPYPPITEITNITTSSKPDAINKPINITIKDSETILINGYIQNNSLLTYKAGYTTMSKVPNILLYILIGHLYSFYTTRLISPPENIKSMYVKLGKISI